MKLPAAVNVNGPEIGAPSGKSLLFARDTKGPDSGELFLLREGGGEEWPLRRAEGVPFALIPVPFSGIMAVLVPVEVAGQRIAKGVSSPQ